MDKHKLYRVWKLVRPIHSWHFLAIAALFLGISVAALRENNYQMVRLREQVYQADKEDGDVQKALTDLQRFVTTHMNTDLTPGTNAVYPPIQLKHSYERLQAANIARAGNQKVYQDAQKHCESLNSTDFSGKNRVPCIQEYVKSHGTSIEEVPESLYKYDFLSPTWSPDLAGFSILATGLFTLLALVFWPFRNWLHRQVK